MTTGEGMPTDDYLRTPDETGNGDSGGADEQYEPQRPSRSTYDSGNSNRGYDGGIGNTEPNNDWDGPNYDGI